MYAGVRVERDTVVRKERRIPTKGEVLVGVGDVVEPDAVLARGSVMSTEVQQVKIYAQLNIDPEEVGRYMLKGEGDEVKKDEAIAIRRSFFGRSTKVCRSPIDGTIENFSKVSGRALIRGKPIQVEVRAHIPGRVMEVIPGEGAVLESRAALIQGVFGVGGEARGELVMAVGDPGEALASDGIGDTHGGKVLVGGSLVTLDALRKAVKAGVRGVVAGGVDQKDLTDFLGYEIGLGVTGDEKPGLALIVTEGFGAYPMKAETFNILKSLEGRLACLDGSTQIRTNMLRPEVIIPLQT